MGWHVQLIQTAKTTVMTLSRKADQFVAYITHVLLRSLPSIKDVQVLVATKILNVKALTVIITKFVRLPHVIKILIWINVLDKNVSTTQSVNLKIVSSTNALTYLIAHRIHSQTVDVKAAIALKILIAILAAVSEVHAAQEERAKHHPLLTQTNAKEWDVFPPMSVSHSMDTTYV